ncbi:MAG: protein kinase [Cyanobacteria bacterium P01_A01_bin.114]
MQSELPDPNRGQRALAAIVVTDAVGFSARMSADEENTLRMIHRDLKLMAQCCKKFEGRVLKSTGDGLLMSFVSAVQAVSCTLAIQRYLARAHALAQANAQANTQASELLLHRIGVHLGDVFFSQSDVMGNGVNIAARLQTQARPGGICLSQVVYDVVRSRLTLHATPTGPLNLKNIQESVSAYHVSTAAPVPKISQPPQPASKAVSKPAAIKPAAIKPAISTPAISAPASGGLPYSSEAPLPVDTKVAGRYTVKKVLGQGGFGISYLAQDSQRFDECCVLKEFKPVRNSGKALQKAINLFKREAKTLYQINHPQIPKFLACFTQAQRLFIVIEYIDGVNYLNLLQQRKQEGQRFSETEMIPWLMQMLRVVDHLHSLNIMHRDISPENVMYSKQQQMPVLIDFGLVNNAVADLLDDEASNATEQSATVAGKFGYSPPEQMRLGKCFPSSDLYALGVTVIVLMTGKHPRDLMDRDSLEWRWQTEITVQPAFLQILEKLTRPVPRERYQSAQETIASLVAAFPSQVNDRQALQLTPIKSPQSPPSSAISPGQDPKFMQQCRAELSRRIGPIADIVIRETLEQHPQATPQELVQILATQISQADQAESFINHIQLPTSLSGGSPGNRLSSASTALQSSDNTTTAPDEVALSPDFLHRCRQALTRCIGPMADLILDETVEDYPHLTPTALVQQLAAEIPNAKQAQAFRQEMKG